MVQKKSAYNHFRLQADIYLLLYNFRTYNLL